MSLSDDRLRRAAQASCSQVLERYGARYAGRRNGETVWFCPFHKDVRTPNLYVTEHRNLWFCFACASGGNVFSLLGRLKFGDAYSGRGWQFVRVVEELENGFWRFTPPATSKKAKLRFTLDDVARLQRALSQEGYRYLFKRGIPHPEHFLLGEIALNGVPYISIPLVYEGRLVLLKARRNDLINTTAARFYTFPGSEGRYPFSFFASGDSKIFFFEDFFSAMAARALGFPAASLAGGNTIPRAGRELYRHLFERRQLFLIPDADKAGENLAKAFFELGIAPVRVQLPPSPYKDFNEYAQADLRGAYGFLSSLYSC